MEGAVPEEGAWPGAAQPAGAAASRGGVGPRRAAPVAHGGGAGQRAAVRRA
jgi:hypothetical protein